LYISQGKIVTSFFEKLFIFYPIRQRVFEKAFGKQLLVSSVNQFIN